MNFNEITKALAEISSISSGNEKLAWLKAHDDNDLKEVFKWYFDNSYPTGISEKKYGRGIEGSTSVRVNITFSDVMDYLKVHNTGRDSDLDYIMAARMIICATPEESECYKKLVCKNYPMGIDAKTINKVFKNLVPTFDVCLCDKYYDKPERVDGKREFAISTKIDGCRVIAIKENGTVRLISRQGKPWTGLVEVENDIKNLVADNFVLDGELTIDNFMKYPSKEVYKMTTKIVSTKDEVKKGITLNAFDMMSLANWNEKNCSLTYDERQTLLKNTLKATDHPHISYVEDVYTGYDVSKIEELMKGVVRTEDWEGLVIKFTDSIYEWKRSKNWLKVKQMETYDLIIVDIFEGENSLTNSLGGFIAEITLPDGKFVHTEIGSGFTLEDRELFWKTRSSLIGKAIEVQGFELTTTKESLNYSIRFPVFKGFIDEGKELNGDYKGV